MSDGQGQQEQVGQVAVEGQQGQLDDTELSAERQAELQAAYDAHVAMGKAPYQEVRLRTRAEVVWVLRERGWSVEADADNKDHPT